MKEANINAPTNDPGEMTDMRLLRAWVRIVEQIGHVLKDRDSMLSAADRNTGELFDRAATLWREVDRRGIQRLLIRMDMLTHDEQGNTVLRKH